MLFVDYDTQFTRFRQPATGNDVSWKTECKKPCRRRHGCNNNDSRREPIKLQSDEDFSFKLRPAAYCVDKLLLQLLFEDSSGLRLERI